MVDTVHTLTGFVLCCDDFFEQCICIYNKYANCVENKMAYLT